jgi:hypothetical protein
MTPYFKILLQREKKFLEKFYKNWGIVYFVHMSITKKKYRGKVEVFTRANLKWSNLVVPEGMTVDHKFPVSMGHKLGIPPEYIADLRNIQFLSITENISKGNKCTFIPIYIQKYLLGIASNEIIMNAREKQMEGIKRAKELGRYTGRKVGSKETPELFFEKERTKRIVELKKLGVGNTEVSEKLLVSYGTVHKVVKMMEKFPHLVK